MEQNHYPELTKVRWRRALNIIWFFLPLIVLNIVCMACPTPPEIEIVEDECSIIDYYSSLDLTTCSLTVTFNQSVYSGEVTVAFYDEKNKLLETQEIYLYGDSCEKSCSYISIDGEADSYEILDYSDIESSVVDDYYDIAFLIIGVWALIRLFYAFPIAGTAVMFSCKVYSVSGQTILVYAGRMRHYIKVNGTIVDEKKLLISFTPITLETTLDTGERIEVFIPSITKRMTVRSDGTLCQPLRV